MFQAIAEVVKQGMNNIANSAKNAQVNGSVAEGGVGLINPDFKKTDSNSENENKNENSVSQTTENNTKVETTKQDSPSESDEGGSGGTSGLGALSSLGGKGGLTSSSGGGLGGLVSSLLSDKKTKTSKDVSSNTNFEKAKDFGKNIASELSKTGTTTPTVVSDERLKDIFGEETPIDCFAKIHSYEFKYTPQAQEMMQGKDHVDDKEHLGVMAQELLMNPATSACVIKDTDGFLKVDTAQLTMANTATIAELSRKVQQLEQMLGER